MRTAQILKYSVFGVFLAGIFLAKKFFDPSSLEFWFIVFLSLVLLVILRLLANIGQLIYEIRNDALRILSNTERALYYSNSLSKEIRDLLESNTAERDKK